MELEHELSAAIAHLKSCPSIDLGGRTNISLKSGCELFMKSVTRAALEIKEFAECKIELLRRGEKFAGMSLNCRHKIAEIGHSFVQDSCTVLTYGHSRVVMTLLLKAAESKQFNIICIYNEDGIETSKKYVEAGIPTTMIAESAVGVFMEQVDLCIVGAEGVMENGGIVNKVIIKI